MDRFNDLTLFVRVAQVLSFSEAARQLGMSPSRVSRAVQRLEERLGVCLLQRTTRSLSLTPDGAVYFERGLQILEELEELEVTLSQTRSVPRGVLRVDLSAALGRIHIAPALAKWVMQYPELQVKVSLSDLMIDLNEEGIDVSVRVGSSPDSRLIAYPLAKVPFTVCAAPDYLAQQGRPETPADLASHNCINFVYPQSGRRFEWLFEQSGQPFEHAVTGNLAFDSIGAMLESAIACAGIIQAHDYIVGKALQDYWNRYWQSTKLKGSRLPWCTHKSAICLSRFRYSSHL
ncbi:LysR family transcriptional regulator [Leptothoe sp. EHU-05/26/07-4]